MIRRLIALTIVAALAFAGGFVVGTNGRRDLTSFTADKARLVRRKIYDVFKMP